jgi:hypothetical protein
VSSSTGTVSSPAWTFRTSADSERVCSEADCANSDALNCAAAAGFSAFSADTTLGVSAGCVDDRIESGICGRDPGSSGQRHRQTANRAASLVKESVASCGHLPTHGSSDVRRRQHQAPTLPSLDRLAAAMAFRLLLSHWTGTTAIRLNAHAVRCKFTAACVSARMRGCL